MITLFTFNKTFISLGVLLVFNIASAHTKCNNPSLDIIDQLDNYLEEIEKENEQYVNTLSENDLIYRMVDLREPKFQKLFLTCVAPIMEKHGIRTIKSKRLETLFNAVQTIAFYSEAPEPAKTLHAILDEALRRNNIQRQESWPSAVYASYIKARLFEQANQLALRFPHLTFEKLPEFKDQHSKDTPYPSLMELQNDGKTLIRLPFPLPSGGHIIVVSHPFCHFSRNALSAITSDLELESIFINHSTWIMPTKDSLDIEGVLQANNESLLKYRYVYLQSEWPEIDYWGTPAFYFYKNGNLLQKIVGWPEEGRKKEILEALQLIGLTISSSKGPESSH